jgi:hypothetical protein
LLRDGGGGGGGGDGASSALLLWYETTADADDDDDADDASAPPGPSLALRIDGNVRVDAVDGHPTHLNIRYVSPNPGNGNSASSDELTESDPPYR